MSHQCLRHRALTYGNSLALKADAALGAMRRTVCGERPALITVLLHNIFESHEAAQSGIGAPNEGITLSMLRQLLGDLARAGFRFVTPEHIARGLDRDGRDVLLTFDDGYYSWLRILPILEEYSAPATFFLATAPILEGKAFWWDAVHRAEYATHSDVRRASAAVQELKPLPVAQIEEAITTRYGRGALDVVSDVARPMTPKEVRSFSRHHLVHIGNHTRDHAFLTTCDAGCVAAQIGRCQDDILALTGTLPVAISYPYGQYDATVVHAAQDCGLKIGVTCVPGKNQALRQGQSDGLLTLRRFGLQGHLSISDQVNVFRSDVSVAVPTFSRITRSLVTARQLMRYAHRPA